MMRMFLILWGLSITGCTPDLNVAAAARSQAQRDVEGYAIATCLTEQKQAYLQDQGDAWASVIVQRSKGDISTFSAIAGQVKNEVAKSEMPLIREEGRPRSAKTLPLPYCSEIIDSPAVRMAIQKAISALQPAYEQR